MVLGCTTGTIWLKISFEIFKKNVWFYITQEPSDICMYLFYSGHSLHGQTHFCIVLLHFCLLPNKWIWKQWLIRDILFQCHVIYLCFSLCSCVVTQAYCKLHHLGRWRGSAAYSDILFFGCHLPKGKLPHIFRIFSLKMYLIFCTTKQHYI